MDKAFFKEALGKDSYLRPEYLQEDDKTQFSHGFANIAGTR